MKKNYQKYEQSFLWIKRMIVSTVNTNYSYEHIIIHFIN